jgi:PAS domain S-box-containing protein
MTTHASPISAPASRPSSRSTAKEDTPPPIFSDSFWKRFRKAVNDFPVPVIALDDTGTIQALSLAARRMLGYRGHDEIEPYFFTHVHGQNMHRVMRDLAHMVNAHTRRASWLVRLQTQAGRWRWFRVEAVNRLRALEQCIVLRMRSV